MGSWTIYRADGAVREVVWSDEVRIPAGRYAVPELEYNGEWMGEAFVTLTVRCAVPVEFEVGDYVLYRGEKFVMNYDPTVVKKARRGTHGEGFVYENVKFNSLGSELSDARMLDYVIDDNLIHYSGLPKFSFFCKDVDDLADRLQVNMNRYCDLNGFATNDYWLFLTPSTDGQGNPVRTLQRAASCGMDAGVALARWTAVYGGTADGRRVAYQSEKVNQNVSVDNQSVWDCCKNVKDVFGLNFIVRGRDLCIGTAGLPTADIFRYGKGKGLYEIERTADSEQAIVTKLFAYGSSRNLPTRYYANLNAVCFLTITGVEENGNDGTQDNYLLSYVGDADVYGMFRNRTSTDNGFYCTVGVRLSVTGDVTETLLSYNTSRSVGLSIPCVTWQGYERGEGLPVGTQVYFYSGIDKDKWPAGNTDYSTDNLPNNMALDVLMLPGFPNQSLYDWVLANGGTALQGGDDNVGHAEWRGHRAYFSKDKYQPYILSENYLVLGIREAAKYFDGSDGEDEIFPTIENTGKDAVVSAERILDNGVFGEGDIPNFKIRLPDFGSGFDLKALLQSDTAIEMKDGYCGGRSFSVVGAKKVDGVWECECKRSRDDALDLYFPYQHGTTGDAYQVLAGDKYVLTGIEMTDTYVEEAAKVLLEASLVFLDANDYTRYTYVPRVDEIYMARQHDAAVASRGGNAPLRSYYETLKEGDVMLFEDADLGIDGSVFIDTLRIKEYGNGQIPTYEVTLRNDKQVGTIQRIQEKINSLTSTGGGGGGGVNVPQIQSLIGTYGKELFLSKKEADAAQGVISLLKGALFGEGGAWGYVKQVAGEVRSWFKNLATDILTVTGHVKGNNGTLNVYDNIYSTGDGEFDGSLYAETEIRSGGNIVADNDIIADDGKFSGTVTTKNLTVTGLAHFFELVIDKIRSAGGAQIFSPAEGFKVEAVNRFEYQGYVRRRLWWRASDGDTTTSNMWQAGDQAICKNFNDIFQPGSYQQAGNKHYWAVVAWAGTTSENSTPTWDATNPAYVAGAPNPYEVTKWHYIDIYADDEGMPIPVDADGKPLWDGAPWAAAAGDDVAQLGHRGGEDTKRGNALYICAYKSIDRELEAPLIAYYEGINDFDLASHRTTYKDADNGVWVGSMKVIVEGTSTDIVAYISSQLELTENHFMTQISTLPISRNLLLNTEFADVQSGGVRALHVVGSTTGARLRRTESRKLLGHEKYFIVSFYGRGSGTVTCQLLVKNGNTTVRTSNQSLTLTQNMQRKYAKFNTNITGANKDEDGYSFILTFSCSGSSQDIYISRPQLEEVDSSVTTPSAWTGTESRNLLPNSSFGEVYSEVGVKMVSDWEYANTTGISLAMEVPPYWIDWNDDTSILPERRDIQTEGGINYLYLNPTKGFQGLAYLSSGNSGGRYEKILEHGEQYTLSLWATGSGNVSALIHLYKIDDNGNPTMVAQNDHSFELTEEWVRYTWTFTVWDDFHSKQEGGTDLQGYGFKLMLGCAHWQTDPPQSELISIRRVQLEKGATASDWQAASYDGALRSSWIKQTADEVSLAVKVDGVNRAGVTLDSNGVTIDGDKLHFNGTINDEVTIEGANLHILNDIDLQGLTTENVTPVERNPYIPTVINMGIGASSQSEVIKSVQVKGNYWEDPYSGDKNYYPHMVVLPFYDALVGDSGSLNWWSEGNTDITFDVSDSSSPLYRSFEICDNAALPEWRRKVVTWKKNGTRLVISNEFITKYRNWQNAESSDAGNLGGFVVVCADGRVVCKKNLLSDSKQFNPSESDGSSNPICEAGCFSCGGYIARLIVLLPGQTLQLRSQIILLNGREVLTWIVENPTEFVPYTWYDGGWKQRSAEFNYDDQEDAKAIEFKSGYASFNPVNGYHGSYEAGIMVPEVMRLRGNQSQDYTDSGISFTDLFYNEI